MTTLAPWSLRRRVVVGTGAALGGCAALVLGATMLAQYASSRQQGALVGFFVVSVAPLGLYGFVAACWGAWGPGSDVKRRINGVRIACAWALFLCLYLLTSFPVLGPMSREEWGAFARIVIMAAGAATGVFAVARSPRLTMGLLTVCAGLATLIPIGVVRAIIGDNGITLGPAMTLSVLMASSLWLALLSAALLGWPLGATREAA